MSQKAKQYWTSQIQKTGSDICLNCGLEIDYGKTVAIMTSRVKVDINATDEEKAMSETFYFCPDCGTDLDRLHELGMKSFLGLNHGPSGDMKAMLEDAEEVKHGKEDIH